MTAGKVDFAFTDDLDLSDEQVYITQETYSLRAKDYVLKFERNFDVADIVIPKVVDPFLDLIRLSGFGLSPLLVAGCGSGRDANYCFKQGFNTLGIDNSRTLLQIGKELKVKAKLKLMDINKLKFPINHFGGIYCDSALSHIKKIDLPKVLSSFKAILKKDGLILIGLRLGDGRVYYTEDDLGARRYYNTHTLEEAEDLAKRCGFAPVKNLISNHTVTSRPKWLYLYLKSR